MQEDGQPLLGCLIVPRTAAVSTMKLTNIDLQVSPAVDSSGSAIASPTTAEADMATLNYLCAADGDFLPPAAPFHWNWVDKSEVGDHDGVLSINRNTFANYFRHQLSNYISNVCIQPYARVFMKGLYINYEWNFHPGQSPTEVSIPPGQTVVKYHYESSSSDRAGINGALGAMTIKTSFDLTIEFVGNKIIITQHLVVYLYVKQEATSKDGNVYDKTITDTYTIGIDAQGQLEAPQSTPVTDDKSGDINTDAFQNFFTRFNDITAAIKISASAMGA